MRTDFFFILYWWFLLFFLGCVFLPLTSFVFKKFFDKGYAFSKIIGLLGVSYFIWILGSLKILTFTLQGIWLIIFFGIGINLLLMRQRKKDWRKFLKKNWKIFAFEEVLFFFALFFWSWVRGFQPDIEGLEKFMDFGFVNSILRSQSFPPADPWLAGKTINYYYFGHLIAAVLTKLSTLDSSITYNLLVATQFSFGLTAAFCIGANFFFLLQKKILVKVQKKLIIFAGLLAMLLMNFGGNFHPLYWFIKEGNFKNYWYPDATRFIVEKFGAADNTIHEFPIYSYVVADLHGHLLNLPLVLLFLALILCAVFKRRLPGWFLVLTGFLLAIFYMTNTWDFAIYLLLFGAFVSWFYYLKLGFSFNTLIQAFSKIAMVFLAALIFSLPFHLTFSSMAQGIALVDFHSPAWMLVVLWGFPLLISGQFLIWLWLKKINVLRQKANLEAFVIILIGLAWFLILVPEVLYLKDIYIRSHQRANTMFKLTYQSFIIFSLTGSYIVTRILASFKQKTWRFLYFITLSFFLYFIFRYPVFAIKSYYGLVQYRGLYGLNFLQQQYPDDYQAILWLKNNVNGQPVVVEAVGESYTDFARVSANTGLPTILGWRVHEWLWRGSFDEPASRTEEVRIIYESPSLEETMIPINKYRVKYIFVGELEGQTYPQLQEKKFEKLGKLIFSSGATKIYQIN